ncbi:MAG: hypothetical protein AVDCRST_MAG17-122, partial [uncultured Solirubrobacterales bacterium]
GSQAVRSPVGVPVRRHVDRVQLRLRPPVPGRCRGLLLRRLLSRGRRRSRGAPDAALAAGRDRGVRESAVAGDRATPGHGARGAPTGHPPSGSATEGPL